MEFTCAGGNSRYIGESTHHFSIRIKEHISTDKNSHIFKHLEQSKTCSPKYSPNCFKILNTAQSQNLKKRFT